MATRATSIGTETKCLTESQVTANGGQLIKNNDGTVSVYMPDGNGVSAPVILSKICCETLGSQYTFDIDAQKCRWADKKDGCAVSQPIKIVLNPKGNDGAIFSIDPNETCELTIDFDYLFKVKCESLFDIMNQSVQMPTDPVTLLAVQQLQAELAEMEKNCALISATITELQAAILQTPYSIVCNDTVGPVKVFDTVPVEKVVGNFSNTGFGRMSSVAPFSFYLAGEAVGTFCLTEPAGLAAWNSILGNVRYANFLAGDASSYTCADVSAIVSQNTTNLLTDGPVLLNACDVPFGTRTQLEQDLAAELLAQKDCQKIIASLNAQILELEVVVSETNGCARPIDLFETLDVSFTLDVVTSANTLQTVYSEQLFGPIGFGNLYSYLTTHQTNSGFYVCGDPTVGESGFTNCTPLSLDVSSTTVPNVYYCDGVMGNLMDALFGESGLSGTTDGVINFNDSLSPNVFASQWLHYHSVINDPSIIAQIADQKIKISIKINDSCGDFCVLLDEIVLDKTCSSVAETNLFLTTPPGFELERIRDNKKSWIANNTPVNRPFKISDNKGNNSIRQTNYDVNDERLVINTKEVDLDINIAAAIETDVWCYIADNPCLLSGTCTPLEVSCPVGYTLMSDRVTCQKIEYTAVTTGSSVYVAVEGAKRCDSIVTYGENGGVFYPDLTTLNLPLNVSGGSIHNQSVVIDAFNNIVPIEQTVLNSLWGNGVGSCPWPCDVGCPGHDNRINKIGIWTSPNAPDTEWVGWSFCVNIPTTGVYTIGIAADDACRVKVNGNMTFSFDGAGWNFLAFRMFPITLNSGLNIIEMEIQNSGGGSATLAAEIYSANTSVISGITSESGLTPYIVFSTGDYVGQNWQTGEDSGFSCPSGYALNTCSNPYTCVKISKTGATTTGDCCDPCVVYSASCGNKSFQDDECFMFQDAEVYEFMDGDYTPYPSTTLNGSNCCGDAIDFNKLMTQPLSAVTTIEDFEYFLTSELIDAKNRQTISGYPTLRALYDRYMSSQNYCDTNSAKFTYMTMDQFAGLIDNYWVDIVEQVVPATTIWGSVKVYGNTLFDQQKFRYRKYSSLFCDNPFSGQVVSSPINGTSGKCASVEVSMTSLQLSSSPNVRMRPVVTTCNSVCLAQMNSGSEFIGTVSIVSPSPSDCSLPTGRQIGSIVVNECSLIASVTTDGLTATANLVGAVGDVEYIWSNGETGQTATFVSGGTYSLTVIDSACCQSTTEFSVSEPPVELTACWYSMVEKPAFVIPNVFCDSYGEGITAITFSVDSIVVNGTEHIVTPFTSVTTSATTNLVTADGGAYTECTPPFSNTYTYTDVVDLLNQAFTSLGLTHYKAQISRLPHATVAEESPLGLYIIRPISDTFSIQTSSNMIGSITYTESDVTAGFGYSSPYYTMSCENIILNGDTVYEEL